MLSVLGFAIGALGFMVGLFVVAMGLLAYYRYHSGSPDRHVLNFPLVGFTVGSIVSILASISFGAMLVPLEISWVALGTGIIVGFMFGGIVFALAKRGLLKPPKERWMDIKLR